MDGLEYLQTKLNPSETGEALYRQRLHRHLEPGLEKRLLLVTGPAGSGKSTLLSEFSRLSRRPIAWLSLGPEDEDPSVFFNYFLESLCQRFPGSCDKTRNLWIAENRWSEKLSVHLVNELVRYQHPLAVVLDDFHLVEPVESVLTLLRFLCRRGPKNLTLILATRQVPDLPLAWLRGKNLLVELHEEDLRFQIEETRSLFEDLWQIQLTQELLEILQQKTEGWVTGLQLIAQRLSGQQPHSQHELIRSLDRADTIIYDYLASEVFQQQSQPIQEFLLATSLPEAFTPALAATLLGELPVVELLQQVKLARLFLVRLDRSDEWYRYHHLFSEFLRNRLLIQHGSERVCTLHRQCAEWFVSRGELVSALPHFFAAGNPELACDILEKDGSELLHRGLKDSVLRWIESLAPGQLRQRPGLQVLLSEIHDLEGNWSKAVEGYRKALDHYRQSEDNLGIASVLEKLCLCYVKYGETQPLLELCEEGLRLCPEDQLSLKAMLLCWQGTTLVNNGEQWSVGYSLIQQGHGLATSSNDPRAISWATLTYGFVFHFPQGNFPEALRTLNEGIDFFGRLGWLAILYQLSMNKAVVLIIMGRIQEAHATIDETLVQASRAGHSYVEKGLQLLRAMAYLEGRQLEESEKILSRISQVEIPAQFKPYFYRSRLLLHALTGNLEQAGVDAVEMERSLLANGAGLYAPECRLSLAYFLMVQGDPETAQERLEANLELCWTAQARFWEMKTWQMLAWLHWNRRQVNECARAFGEAIRICKLNHYDDYWICDPWRVGLPLLMNASATQVDHEYCSRLLHRLDSQVDEVLGDFLISAHEEVRKTALQHLATRPGERSRLLLEAALREDPSPEVRQLAKLLLRQSELTARLEIRCFGVFRIFRDGIEVDYGRLLRPLAIRLLKYFVVHGTRLIPCDRILDTFWPELDSERGRHNLATHLSAIRKRLAISGLFQRVGEAFRLARADEFEFDVRDFEEQIQRGLELAHQGESEQSLVALEKAALMYRGDFLESDLYEDWIEVRRLELQSLHQRCLETLGDLHFQRGAFREAIRHYQALLEAKEPQEQIFPKLSRCYQALGEQSAIFREFEQLRQRLRENLGLEPKPSTQAIVDALSRFN